MQELVLLLGGVLRVMRHGQRDLAFQNLFHTDTAPPFDLLLSALLVLLAHMHDCRCL